MFIVDLAYSVPLKELDAHMKEHIKFLTKYYKSGDFLVSGRKVPRTGGIIVAATGDRGHLEKILKEDPFKKHDLADFTITEFNASQSQPALKLFIKGTKS